MRSSLAIGLVLIGFSSWPANAQDPPPPTDPAAAERARLEAELKAEMAAPPEDSGGTTAPAAPRGGAAQTSLLDLSFDLLTAAGGSSADDSRIELLEQGDHDPHRRGFTIQNFEITGTGVVDPYFSGEVHLVLKLDRLAETTLELEEAFLTTAALPGGLQVKAGQMFEAFGRQNPQHPHAWAFVDHTVVGSRFLGPDGLRSQGVEVSWLAPTPWFLLLTGGVYNANGGTEYSFVNEDAPPLYANATPREVSSPADLQYVARLATNLDFGDTVSSTLGASYAHGPNSTGPGADTDLFGADLYLRWKPLATDQGWPFLAFQAEWMGRSYHVAGGTDTGGAAHDEQTLFDWGYYAQLVWGFHTRWTAGVRWDQALGKNARDYPESGLLNPRQRVSPALTFYPSEFSKLRLQYNFDHETLFDPETRADSTKNDHSVWIQFEFLLGKHGAHKF